MDWIPSITTTSLLVGAIWLGRNLLLERLKGAVRNEFDGKLENLKSDIREKERQIDALRSGALSSSAYRKNFLYERKVKATEEIWNAVSSMAGAKNLSEMMVSIKFEEAAKEAAKNQQLRAMFQEFGKIFDPKKMDLSSAARARPFLTKLAWAYYSAYQSIISQSIIRMEMLKAGLDKDFSKNEKIIALAKAALPNYQEYIDKHGNDTLHYLLDELEKKLLSEIENILNGKDDDQESIKNAANILRTAEDLMEEKNETIEQ